MSDRRDFRYRQKVQEGELDDAFDVAEQGDRDLAADHGLVGVVSGLVVSENSPTPNLTVDVTQGIAYDQLGQRVEVVVDTAADLAADSDDVTTAVTGSGNEKWLSLYAKFDRLLIDPQLDGNGDTVYWERNEFFRFVVVQGAEAAIGLANRPSLLSDAVLLADVRREFGVSSITDADISTTRRMDAFVLSAGSLSVREGTAEASDQALLDHLNDHVTGVGAHPASAVAYAGGGAWADGTTNPAASVEAQLDKNISDLANTTTNTSGARKLGVEALVGASSTISAGTLYLALLALKTAANLDVAARSAWLGGRTNPAATLQAALEKIVVDLGLTSVSDDGAERVGGQAVAGSPESFVAGSVRSQLDALLGWVNDRARKAAAETISGAWTFSGARSRSGNGATDGFRVPHGSLTDADATVDVTFDTYDGASLTASRSYTLKSTSPAPPAGTRIHFVQKNAYGGGFFSRFRRESMALIADVPATSWATFEFDGTDWYTIAWGPNVISIV